MAAAVDTSGWAVQGAVGLQRWCMLLQEHLKHTMNHDVPAPASAAASTATAVECNALLLWCYQHAPS